MLLNKGKKVHLAYNIANKGRKAHLDCSIVNTIAKVEQSLAMWHHRSY
jgi:hypothetical protein